MIVFYTIAGEMFMFWCDLDAVINDKGDSWDICSNQGSWSGVKKALVSYGYFKYKEIKILYDEEDNEIPQYMADLNLEPMTADDLPVSEHIGKLTAVDVSKVKLATVTRRWHGVNYDTQCLATQSVKDLYQAGDIQIDDYVLVSFIEEIPNETERNIAIVTDKVYQSW